MAGVLAALAAVAAARSGFVGPLKHGASDATNQWMSLSPWRLNTPASNQNKLPWCSCPRTESWRQKGRLPKRRKMREKRKRGKRRKRKRRRTSRKRKKRRKRRKGRKRRKRRKRERRKRRILKQTRKMVQ